MESPRRHRRLPLRPLMLISLSYPSFSCPDTGIHPPGHGIPHWASSKGWAKPGVLPPPYVIPRPREESGAVFSPLSLDGRGLA